MMVVVMVVVMVMVMVVEFLKAVELNAVAVV